MLSAFALVATLTNSSEGRALTLKRRLTTKFCDGALSSQYAGAPAPVGAGRRSPAAEHFMRPRPLQRRVRRLAPAAKTEHLDAWPYGMRTQRALIDGHKAFRHLFHELPTQTRSLLFVPAVRVKK